MSGTNTNKKSTHPFLKRGHDAALFCMLWDIFLGVCAAQWSTCLLILSKKTRLRHHVKAKGVRGAPPGDSWSHHRLRGLANHRPARKMFENPPTDWQAAVGGQNKRNRSTLRRALRICCACNSTVSHHSSLFNNLVIFFKTFSSQKGTCFWTKSRSSRVLPITNRLHTAFCRLPIVYSCFEMLAQQLERWQSDSPAACRDVETNIELLRATLALTTDWWR